MSPVSRGRKPKKNKKRIGGARRGGLRIPAGLLGPIERPDWFDAATGAVLGATAALPGLSEPLELEDAVARLLGEHLYQVIGAGKSMRFDWWFGELVSAAAARIRETLDDPDGGWRGPWWLLHGLAAIATPPVASTVAAAQAKLAADVRKTAGEAGVPSWLDRMSQVTATGEVWHMRDVYGGRTALIAGFRYPEPGTDMVYLFDFDACGFVRLADAGTYSDLDAAAQAWRGLVGAAAGDAKPEPVIDADALACLVYWETGEMHVTGSETRAVMDNWLRARRRAEDLADALQQRSVALPPAKNLYADIDTEPTVDAFTQWYAARHGTPPDGEVVGALAYEWLEGAMPGTEHLASPHRVAFQLGLIGDWVPDDPVTLGVQELMPEWVRFHGEQTGLPGALMTPAVAVATGGELPESECPGAR
jgi:hypothetical protein